MSSKLNVASLLGRFNDGCQYRQVTRDDLRPGVRVMMFPIPNDRPVFDPGAHLGDLLRVGARTEIQIDNPPFNSKKTHAMYHCVSPAWDGQCFVPVGTMCDPDQGIDPGPDWLTLFLIKKM